MRARKPSGGAGKKGDDSKKKKESGVLKEMRRRPSDSVNLVGETAASEALTPFKPIGPSEAESRNALGPSPVEPDRHRHASRRKPRR